MKVKRKGDLLRVDLHPNETTLLMALLHDVSVVLRSEDRADPVVKRLYPDGYADDADAAAEFRELVAASLRDDRLARVGQCQAQLPTGGGQMLLDAAAADSWLRVLNDIRLALGTRLGVSEDEQWDSSADDAQIYYWLSGMQEMLVEGVMR